MKHFGAGGGLAGELFPDGFVAEVMTLVLETWDHFSGKRKIWKEERITALFRDALREAYFEQEKEWFVTLEDPVTDEESGEQLGRSDLRFFPPFPFHRAQSVYLTLECKRLNIQTERFSSGAREYVEDGMMRFVNGQYSNEFGVAGMIGYVMDGNLDEALKSIDAAIKKRRRKLKLNGWRSPSTTTPSRRHSADTLHVIKNRDEFQMMHHLLSASWLAPRNPV